MANAVAETEKPSLNIVENTPKLSPYALSVMLILMCIVPLATIAFLWAKLPPARVESLDAEIIPVNLLPPETFKQPIRQRVIPSVLPSVIVRNVGDEEWTLVNVRVNNWFEFYETHLPIPPGGEIEVPLHHCRGKDGTPFDPMQQPLRQVRVFAKLPAGYRATHSQDFDVGS